MAETKLYTIPLRREFQKASYKRRTNKAVKALKEYVTKHTKCDRVVLGEELNEHLWSKGITNPPAKVKVEITVDVVKNDKEEETKEAFVNLIGFKRKVIKQTKKGILNKENAGLKGKLQDAVNTLKSDKTEDASEDSESVKVKVPKKKKVVIKDSEDSEKKSEKKVVIKDSKADTKAEVKKPKVSEVSKDSKKE